MLDNSQNQSYVTKDKMPKNVKNVQMCEFLFYQNNVYYMGKILLKQSYFTHFCFPAGL